MSKQRAINTKFWSDPWVRDELNPLDRYLFLYFLTNEHTNISGVYELPIATIAFETGIEREELERSMIKRLRPKVIYHRSWVVLPNFPKHQNLRSPDILKGIEREFAEAPEQVKKEALDRGWGDGLGMVPHGLGMTRGTKLNLTKLTVASETLAPMVDVPIGLDVGPRPKIERRPKDKEGIYLLFSEREQPWWRHAQQKTAALSLFDLVGVEKVRDGKQIMRDHEDDPMCPQAGTPFEYEAKLPQLTRYVKRKGL